MRVKIASVTGTLLLAGAVAVPGVAGAHVEVGVKSVTAHTNRADAGLARAAAQFEKNARGRAERSFSLSRRQLGKAASEAAKLRRGADTPSERSQAARALAVVASQQDENVERLVEVLGPATSRVENSVAKAALADARGRDKAVAVISTLLEEGVASGSAGGLTKALAGLAQGRNEEASSGARALASADVSSRAKRSLAKAVRQGVTGQKAAADQLAALISSESMPAESKAGLQRAYDAVTAEHGAAAAVLSEFSSRMPAAIRTFVTEVVRQAQEDARSMRDSRPTAPTGGTQTGSPEGSGAPEGTPTGQV